MIRPEVLDDPACPAKMIGPICGRLDDVLTLPGTENSRLTMLMHIQGF